MKTILTLDPFTIDPDEKGRLGFFFPAKAAALGVLMKQDGQNDPIKVVKLPTKTATKGTAFQWKLVAGLHRLRGAQSAGISVKAIEVAGDADLLRDIQLSENLDRRVLDPLERSIFVWRVAEAARQRLLDIHGVDSDQALGGLAKSGRVQFSEIEKADEEANSARDIMSAKYGWRDEVADALDLDIKALQRSMRIHRLIIKPFPELVHQLKEVPAAKALTEMLKLCTVADEAARRRVIEMLIKGPSLSVSGAFIAANVTPEKAEPEPYRKFSGQIMGGWSRLNTADQRRFIPEFVNQLTPAQRSFLRDELNQKEDGQ